MNTHVSVPTTYKTNHPKSSKVKVIKSIKKAKSSVLGVLIDKEVLDNPSYNLSATNSYVKMVKRLMGYRRKYRISPEASEMLIYIYSLYMDNNAGVTVYSIAKVFSTGVSVTSELTSVRNKIQALEAKGLMLNIGSSKSGSFIYIPTVKAINDLSELFK